MADWLEQTGITTVVMGSTGIYWISAFEIPESRGPDVKLVNARHVKNVAGRKSDVLDCQWLVQLHTCGLLNGVFRPDEQVCSAILQTTQTHQNHRNPISLQENVNPVVRQTLMFVQSLTV